MNDGRAIGYTHRGNTLGAIVAMVDSLHDAGETILRLEFPTARTMEAVLLGSGQSPPSFVPEEPQGRLF